VDSPTVAVGGGLGKGLAFIMAEAVFHPEYLTCYRNPESKFFVREGSGLVTDVVTYNFRGLERSRVQNYSVFNKSR